MKLRNLLVGLVLVVGLVGIAGCGKKGASGPQVAPMVIEGVNVDLPKLQASIDASGNADLQSAVRTVMMSFRYRQYDKAAMDMEKLSADPALTEEQKKIATEVFEQVKQVAAKAPQPAPTQ